jgi:phosphoenolpyruvate carboxykinase (ATP)
MNRSNAIRSFGFDVVTQCPGSVPAGVLLPRNIWANRAEYDATAHRLAGLFRDNFHRYENFAKTQVKDAGPRMAA